MANAPKIEFRISGKTNNIASIICRIAKIDIPGWVLFRGFSKQEGSEVLIS